MFNLRHLQYLEAVYKYKNFTQAAEAIYVSQPTISAAINSLEADLGIKLIERSSKNVIFTSEGEQFMIWSHRILGLCDQTVAAMHDLSNSAEHKLRLGMSYAFMDAMAPLIFSDFLPLHPDAQIQMDEGSMYRHIEMIEKEQLDLAYNGFPIEEPPSELEWLPVSNAAVMLVLHPSHPLARLDSVPIESLASEHLVMMDKQSRVNQLITTELIKKNIPINPVLNYTQIICMAGLVKTCRYVGIVSAAAGRKIPGCEGLVLRPFEEPINFELGFFFKKDRYLPKVGWDLIKFIKQTENHLLYT